MTANRPTSIAPPERQVPLASEAEIQSSYRGTQTAAGYVQQRFTNELGRLLHVRQLAAVNEVMRRRRPVMTLEVAPGPARLTRGVLPAGTLVALEFNEGMIAEAKTACRGSVEWVQGNAFALPFGTEFDFVYTFRFVRHFHRDDRLRLYSEIRRILRPGGLLMLDAVNAQVSAPLRQASPDDYPIYDMLYRDADELGSELEEAGFFVEALQPVQRWFSLQYRAQVLLGPRSRLLCRAAIRGLERLRRGPALEWIVTCARR